MSNTKMIFDEDDDYTMIIADDNGGVRLASLLQNIDVIIDALDEIIPSSSDRIFEICDNEVAEARKNNDIETENNAYRKCNQNLKKLVRENWDAVYAIIVDDLDYDFMLYCKNKQLLEKILKTYYPNVK